MLFKLLGLGVLALGAYRFFTGRRRRRHGHAAFASNQPQSSHMDVRDAGPQAMRDSVQRPWTETDEDLDESFPASDPPEGY